MKVFKVCPICRTKTYKTKLHFEIKEKKEEKNIADFESNKIDNEFLINENKEMKNKIIELRMLGLSRGCFP